MMNDVDTAIKNIEAKYGLYRLVSSLTGQFFETWVASKNPKFSIQKSSVKEGFEIIPYSNTENLKVTLTDKERYFKRFENAVIKLKELEGE